MKTIQLIICPELARAASASARLKSPKLKNWERSRPTEQLVSKGDYKAVPFRYKGSYKGWLGHTYIPLYTSFMTVENRRAVYVCGFKGNLVSRVLRAPAGTEWDHDGSIVTRDYGLDFHPTAEDMLSRNFAARVQAGLREARIKRDAVRQLARDQADQQAIYEREIGSVRVTMDDSRRAGNCAEGTLRYAEEKLGIDRETVIAGGYLFSVAASRLLKINGNPGVLRAVQSAWMRETTPQI